MSYKGVIGPLDAYLDFGEVTLGSAGTADFPNVIDMNKSNADSLETVAVLSAAGVGGTTAKLVLKGNFLSLSSRSNSSGSSSDIKPRLPRLIPSTGTLFMATVLARWRIVPSPPKAIS